MAESIEAFVAKLQTEGVQAGKAAADKIQAEAQHKADEIVKQAEARARKIVDDGEAQAKAMLEKSRTDLQLAARDTVLALREVLSRALRAVLAAGTGRELSDAEFLKSLLHNIVMQYVQADLEHKVNLKVNVPPQMQQQLTHWAIQHLHDKAADGDVSIDLKGRLREAGFEYQVDGANVEVTQASVVEALCELVNPVLREMIEKAAAGKKE